MQKLGCFLRAGFLVALVGCKAAVSPAAECREREAHRYDPGPVAIADVPLIVRTIRCEGAFGELRAPCSDDAPTEMRFAVTTSQGPPRCTWDMRSDCWWGNEAGSSHGISPGGVDTAGTYTLSGTRDATGGATQILAHVGVAQASTMVRVRLVLVENPGQVPSDVIDALGRPAAARTAGKVLGPPDGSVWPTHEAPGEPLRRPVIELDGRITAARVHIENASRSIAYDGYFAGSPIALSYATWTAIHRSTEQNEELVVRVSTVSGGIVTATPEQRWRVDHGDFYHSPESIVEDRAQSARTTLARQERERAWILTHSYIPRSEAIARAVRFLEDQGFTKAAPSGPLRRDIVDFAEEAEVRAQRRGSVDPTPVGTLKKAGWWWVAFRSIDGDRCRVRVIAVAADGTRQRMIHQDISLSSFE